MRPYLNQSYFCGNDSVLVISAGSLTNYRGSDKRFFILKGSDFYLMSLNCDGAAVHQSSLLSFCFLHSELPICQRSLHQRPDHWIEFFTELSQWFRRVGFLLVKVFVSRGQKLSFHPVLWYHSAVPLLRDKLETIAGSTETESFLVCVWQQCFNTELVWFSLSLCDTAVVLLCGRHWSTFMQRKYIYCIFSHGSSSKARRPVVLVGELVQTPGHSHGYYTGTWTQHVFKTL